MSVHALLRCHHCTNDPSALTLTAPAVVFFTSSPDARRVGTRLTPRTIPESTIAALRELFVRMVRDEPNADSEGRARAGDEVRHALRTLCENARANEVRVEQLVIAIKQGWSSLHSEHPRARSAGPDALLNHVITLCIDEYYANAEH